MAETQKTVEDFVAYSVFDAINRKGMPKMNDWIENAVASIAYHFFVEKVAKNFDKWLPVVDIAIKEEAIKFIGEGLTLWATRWALGEDGTIGKVALKQVVSQAAVAVYKQAKM